MSVFPPKPNKKSDSAYPNRIPGGILTYYIDVRVARNNKPDLTITQADAQGKQRVIVFVNSVKIFGDAVKQAMYLFEIKK